VVEEPVAIDAGADRRAPARGPGIRGQITRTAAVRGALAMTAFVAVLVVAYFVPLPSVGTVRAWSDSLGPWFIAVFFLAYAIVPISPIPRTPFTLAAGVLFPPAIAFVGVTVASTIAGMAGFYLARRLGRERVQKHLKHPTIAAVEFRLRKRGWLAVGSLRLIAVCPFSLVNYLAGLSSVRPMPFLIATVIGMTPGNAALIFLGDALSGAKSPVSLIFSAVLFSIGVIGLVIDTRLPA